MVDFRKVLLLLVVVVVAIASAQVQQSCTASTGSTPPVRAEGVAEEVGQVVITCTGGTPTVAGQPIPPINVQIWLNTNITSRLMASSGTASEALLLIDEPLPAVQFLATATPPFVGSVAAAGAGAYVPDATHPNVFAAQQTSNNSLTWLNIPLDPPGTTRNRVVRIVNVRANANMAGVTTGTLLPSVINMFISFSGTGAPPINNPQVTVAAVQYGLTFSATPGSWAQCEPGVKTMNLKFKENFGTAFRQLITYSGGIAVDQSVPSTVYNTESMFVNSNYAAPYNVAGKATQATQLIAKFSGVPNNVSIYVPAGAGTTYKNDAGNTVNVGNTMASITSTANTLSLVTSGTSGSTTDANGLVGLTNQAGAVVYNVDLSSSASIDTVTIPVYVVYKASPQAALGTATVSGNYAPTTTVFTASYSAPVPRFVDISTNSSAFTITSCQTNLLFPFVTNQAGFDTGIVISNTSNDPYGTINQSGPCTMYFYGGTAGGGAAPGAQTSSSVAAGAQLVWTASAGGNLGLVSTPGFQGYVIASCNFQYAHGYAFVSDLGANKVAEGYLGLVLDGQFTNFPRTGKYSEVLGF